MNELAMPSSSQGYLRRSQAAHVEKYLGSFSINPWLNQMRVFSRRPSRLVVRGREGGIAFVDDEDGKQPGRFCRTGIAADQMMRPWQFVEAFSGAKNADRLARQLRLDST